MGDGKKLKEILESKGTNVRQIAKKTEISATTLYSIIQKDSNIRLEVALRLANKLEIDVNEICSTSPFSGAITEEISKNAIMNFAVAILEEIAECAKQEDAPVYEGDKEVDSWVRLSDVNEAINKYLN